MRPKTESCTHRSYLLGIDSLLSHKWKILWFKRTSRRRASRMGLHQAPLRNGGGGVWGWRKFSILNSSVSMPGLSDNVSFIVGFQRFSYRSLGCCHCTPEPSRLVPSGPRWHRREFGRQGRLRWQKCGAWLQSAVEARCPGIVFVCVGWWVRWGGVGGYLLSDTSTQHGEQSVDTLRVKDQGSRLLLLLFVVVVVVRCCWEEEGACGYRKARRKGGSDSMPGKMLDFRDGF